jgi:hypothetical protein
MAPHSSQHLHERPFHLQRAQHPYLGCEESMAEREGYRKTSGCIHSLPQGLPLPLAIIARMAPAAEQDPELAAWLEKAPTVLINLGSSVDYDELSATEMAKAIKTLLGSTDVQVPWKLNKRADFPDDFLADLKEQN